MGHFIYCICELLYEALGLKLEINAIGTRGAYKISSRNQNLFFNVIGD